MTTPSLPQAPSPGCSFTGCLDAPIVQWQRRPTADELAAVVTMEQSRRDQAVAAGASPTDDFGPLPTQQDTVIAVLSCGIHAITMDLASLVHASTCTAPNNANLPGCDCTPEPAPAPEPLVERTALPDHWQ